MNIAKSCDIHSGLPKMFYQSTCHCFLTTARRTALDGVIDVFTSLKGNVFIRGSIWETELESNEIIAIADELIIHSKKLVFFQNCCIFMKNIADYLVQGLSRKYYNVFVAEGITTLSKQSVKFPV